jgi:hypothetical protein
MSFSVPAATHTIPSMPWSISGILSCAQIPYASPRCHCNGWNHSGFVNQTFFFYEQLLKEIEENRVMALAARKVVTLLHCPNGGTSPCFHFRAHNFGFFCTTFSLRSVQNLFPLCTSSTTSSVLQYRQSTLWAVSITAVLAIITPPFTCSNSESIRVIVLHILV